MADFKLDDDHKLILNALATMGDPASGKEIAGAVGLDAKLVGNKIKKLKSKGFVDSPVRCKYAITDLGKTNT